MSLIDTTSAPPPARLAPCWGCIALALAVVAAVVASFAYLAVDYRQLFSDPQEMEVFLRDVVSPDWNAQQDSGRTWAAAHLLAPASRAVGHQVERAQQGDGGTRGGHRLQGDTARHRVPRPVASGGRSR